MDWISPRMRFAMKKLAVAMLSVLVAAAAIVARADTTPSLPNGAVGVNFKFTTSVKTPKGTKSANGTISLKPNGPGKLNLTVAASDGTTATIPLLISNGSVQPDTAHMPPPSSDSQSQAAAKALMANMKVAATVGMTAKKSGGSSFTVPVILTPVGQGTPVPSQLTMTATPGSSGAVAYAGSVSGQTTTLLPQSSQDPNQLVKTAGAGVASTAMTPYGRAAMAVAHHREEQMKQAATQPLPDAMKLSVTAHFANGKFQDISGTQTDTLTIENRNISIVSNWSFTKTP
jgi:hypothetical protein